MTQRQCNDHELLRVLEQFDDLVCVVSHRCSKLSLKIMHFIFDKGV